MGMNAGFDMVPRLTKETVGTRNWEQFMKPIKSHYNDDLRIEIEQCRGVDSR